ncbi:MAG TPA: efflux transporter outer membrane subunit [Burkholderiaceae bacterium]|nr:efflux transporter outer membrane subunit [Burkholderiaceae bacterium]
MRHIMIRLALASTPLLAGCAHQAVAPEAAPGIEIPAAWSLPVKQDQPDEPAWTDSSWWQQFGSDELTRLVEQGQSNNPDIGVAISRVRQAEAKARIAGVALLPTADLSVAANRSLPRDGGNAFSAALEIGYEIDFWGKNKAGQAAAQAALQANRFDSQTVALTVTSGIVSTYLQVLSLRDQLSIARQNAANAQRVLNLVDAQSRAGAASPLDLARQRAVLAGQKAVIPDLLQQEREALSALAILLGRPAHTVKVAASGLAHISLPEVAPGMPSSILARRPDIRRAEARLAQANANVAQARAALFPALRLTGSIGAESDSMLSLLSGSHLLANLGAGLLAPIFDAGRLGSQRDISIAEKQELVQVYRAAVMTALSEVETALGQIRSLDAQWRFKTTEMEQARHAFELSEIRYRIGSEYLMTVLDTQRTLSGAQNELGQIKLKRLQATVSLYKALGSL